jgi:hypothetical protein
MGPTGAGQWVEPWMVVPAGQSAPAGRSCPAGTVYSPRKLAGGRCDGRRRNPGKRQKTFISDLIVKERKYMGEI